MLSTLSNVSIEEVYSAFIDAFGDYEVELDMDIGTFEEMLRTRSYNKDLSVGYYDTSTLAGFVLIGYRDFGDHKIMYDTGIKISTAETLDWGNRIKEYCSFQPSWQNAYESYMNVRDKYAVLILEKDKERLGYGLVHTYNGNIMQIGIAPEQRDKKTVGACINGLIKSTRSPVVKYLNVEDGSEMDLLLRELNQKRIVSQYEMMHTDIYKSIPELF